ncbi:MAG: hypothetical protein Q6351_004845 [Candidatus Njordarchaeum guaymaensis]
MTWLNYELQNPESPEEILSILLKFKKLAVEGHWPGLKITQKNKEIWVDLQNEARWFVSLTIGKRKMVNFYFQHETDPAEITAFAFMLLKADKVLIGERRIWNQ